MGVHTYASDQWLYIRMHLTNGCTYVCISQYMYVMVHVYVCTSHLHMSIFLVQITYESINRMTVIVSCTSLRAVYKIIGCAVIRVFASLPFAVEQWLFSR